MFKTNSLCISIIPQKEKKYIYRTILVFQTEIKISSTVSRAENDA